MIEVEKKFAVQKDELARLTAGARFLGEKKFTDIYYDTADYVLTKKDIWLRSRAGKFELKFPVSGKNEKWDMTAYDEIEDDAAISAKLGISGDGPFEPLLLSLGYFPFATITTTRSKYEKDGFHIDVDEVDFGYALLEIELMVSSRDETASAYQRILDFAARNGVAVSEKRIRGKVIEYIKRKNPDHLRALEAAWGIQL
jgi:predicted adenylyl cyclase CyaB